MERALLITGALVLVLVIAWYLVGRPRRESSVEARTFAGDHGLELLDSPDEFLADAIGASAASGHKYKIGRVLVNPSSADGPRRDALAEVCYHATFADAVDAETRGVFVRALRVPVPRTRLKSELVEEHSPDDLADGVDEFDEAFTVLSDNEAFVAKLLTPELRALLMDNLTVQFDLADEALMLTTISWYAEDFPELAKLADDFVRLMPAGYR